MSAEFERPVSVDAARDVLAKAPGLDLIDEPLSNVIPPRSRLRAKITARSAGCGSIARWRTVSRFGLPGDQLLKGAALNAVQIAELL